jgi:signal transduction histidine kinase
MISARDLMDAQKDNLLAVLARQKQASALMGRAKNQAEQANRTKTEFLSRMSHELRTPLNSIIGFSDIIQSQKLGNIVNSNYVDYACEIHKSGSQLLALIDDILSLTRLESGKRQLQDTALDPAQHVSACLDRFADDGRAKNIKIDALLPDDDVRLTADAEMLIRMLDNLVFNAIKFTPDGGCITVDVGLDKAKALLVSVADTGIGINPDALESVLTPFSQAEKLLERNFEGTGLGLALVKMMIEMHEGSLVLKSDLGVGTTITLRFPADRVQIEGTRRAAAL